MFSCEFCEISKNNFLIEHLRASGSESLHDWGFNNTKIFIGLAKLNFETQCYIQWMNKIFHNFF